MLISIALSLLVVLVGYLLGSFNTGYYLVYYRTGFDIRARGSRSTGARNVSRVLGMPGFMLTLLGDAGKGALATWIAIQFGLGSLSVLLAIVAAVVGHIWPGQLGFRGGKGLATALGAGLVFDYLLVVVIAALAILMFAITKHFIVSGLAPFTLSPAVALGMGRDYVSVLGFGFIVLLILIAHRSNIGAVMRRDRQA